VGTDEIENVWSQSALEVDRKGGVADDRSGVLVVDVAAILPQVDGDLVRPGPLADPQGLERIGIVDAPGLSQDGDVIDIDPQFHADSSVLRDEKRL
jgi:hypothetical protein